VKFTAHTPSGLAHRLSGWSSLSPLSVLMSVRQCFIWLFYMQRRGISKKPSETGETHDLVDVANRHCSHCRVRVGVLEEQEMTIPPELQDRLIEVLRLAHDNALEAHQDAQVRYKGYKQHRIDALGAEAVETEAVLMEILKARGNT
jgi:hypothetical protein